MLDLRDTFVSDNEVPCFGRLPKLTHLFFGRTEKGLSLTPPHGFESNGKITDRGVMSMCCSELEDGQKGVLSVLALLRVDITDRSLPKLAAAFALQTLDVTGCNQLTKDGIQAFVTRRPKCQFIC